MWDFFSTVRHRHSVRHYRTDLPVEEEKLHALLEMASAAPSAGDLQAYHISVVRNSALRAELARLANDQQFLAEAPAILVFCADPQRSAATYGERGANLYALQDATIAATYAQLAAVASGLASTWIGFFDEAAVTSMLRLDAGQRPIAMLAIGYAAELPAETTRRPLLQMVDYHD